MTTSIQPRQPDETLVSKTQKKREMDALQDLGKALIGLSNDTLKTMPIPDALREAVLEHKRLNAHGALRRQLQYIGKLMRKVDPAPIQAAIDEIDGVSAAANARQHALERLRARLLEDEAFLSEISATWPGVDLQHLRQLRRNALKEQEARKPPKNFRAIFQLLQELDQQGAPDAAE